MSASNDSVFGLITQLCENVLIQNNSRVNSSNVKKLRTKAFEILLSKVRYESNNTLWLNDCSDYHCQFLAFEYILQHKYDSPEQASQIESCLRTLRSSNADQHLLNQVFHFLLKLKKPPQKHLEDFSINDTEGKFFRIFNNDNFKLNEACGSKIVPQFNGDSFELRSSRSKLQKFKSKTSNDTLSGSSYVDGTNNVSEESFKITADEPSLVWNSINSQVDRNISNWQSYGGVSHKEPRFLSEASPEVYGKFNCLEYCQQFCLIDSKFPSPSIITHEELIHDIKLCLVGISTNSFCYLNDSVVLNPRVVFRGISRPLLDTYCSLIIKCGECYKGLDEMVLQNKELHSKGIIFRKLCASIGEYLQFYKLSVLAIKCSEGLLNAHSIAKNLSVPLMEITSLCKVGPFKDPNEKFPTGVALLNGFYRKVLNRVDNHVILVLYSLLYPLLQLYFEHFLKPWILRGTIDDPYNEFFILRTHKYLATRGRTYWTRSFNICEDLVPIFLIGQTQNVYECGKIMNLLKLCANKPPLDAISENGQLVQCCLSLEQLRQFSAYVDRFYLELIVKSDEIFSLGQYLRMKKDEQLTLCGNAMRQRVAAIKKIELNKLQRIQNEADKKAQLMKGLKDQYDRALIEKKLRKVAELSNELEVEKKLAEMRELQEKAIANEAQRIIDYYEDLLTKADTFNKTLELHNATLKTVCIDVTIEESKDLEVESQKIIEKIEKLDVVNANETIEDVTNSNEEVVDNVKRKTAQLEENANCNFYGATIETRKKARVKYLREGLGIQIMETPCVKMTELQRNRRRVLGTTFDLHIPSKEETKIENLTEAQRNKIKVRQIEYGENLAESLKTHKRKTELSEKNVSEPIPEQQNSGDFIKNEEVLEVPQEVHQVPQEISQLQQETPKVNEEIKTNKDVKVETKNDFVKQPNFTFSPSSNDLQGVKKSDQFVETIRKEHLKSMNGSPFDKVSVRHLGQSAEISVHLQNSLLKQLILKHFVVDLGYLDHLNSLRNYYFLLDGRFARNLTEGLFERLDDPEIQIKTLVVNNASSLKTLMYNALKSSLVDCENAQNISFHINNLPKYVSITDVGVLDCISLSYKVSWPLNVLLSSELLAKYNEVFRFQLKINHVSLVLQKMFLDFKYLIKRCGRHSPLLLLSLQYRKVQAFRHIMTHFIHTFQNYIVGEVLNSSWVEFQNKMENADSLDALYTLHISYIKNIHFMCLFSQNCAVVKKVITNIFIVVLKFYNYARSRDWQLDDDQYVHPNFEKLSAIFDNFIELVTYLFLAGKKVARSGYQPQLAQLIDMLDVNDYYSKIVGASKR